VGNKLIPQSEPQNISAIRIEAVLICIAIWAILAIPGGMLIYDLWSRPSLGDFWALSSAGNLAKSPIALFAYFLWITLVTLFIAPSLTIKFASMLHPTEKRPPTSTRQRMASFFQDTWELLGEIGRLFKTLFPVLPVLYVLSIGIGFFLLVGFGQWFYLYPFAATVLLIAYKINESRKTRGVEAYDEKHYETYDKSRDEYLSLLEKSKKKEKGHPAK
jgi:hypothetical protein